MVERFTIVHLRNYDICDIQDNAQSIPTFYNDLGYIESVQPVCDLLNSLAEENQQLKELAEIGDYQANRIKELTEENQHIRQTIKTLYENERTQIGKNTLRQLIEAIE